MQSWKLIATPCTYAAYIYNFKTKSIILNYKLHLFLNGAYLKTIYETEEI